LAQAEKEQQELAKLKKEVEEWHGDVLLSSEHFDVNPTRESVQRVRELFPNKHLIIVLILRNQIDYSQSLYAEGLKWNVVRTYEEFLSVAHKQNRFDYLRRWHLWKEIGAEVKVVDYELHKKDLLKAFLEATSLKILGEGLAIPHDAANVTPSIDFLEMVRTCNIGRPPEARRAFYEACAAHLDEKGTPELFQSRKYKVPDSADEVFEQAARSNDLLAEELGLDKSAFLDGGFRQRLAEYKSYDPPNALAAMRIFIPNIIQR
jgi:hypothetical protein